MVRADAARTARIDRIRDDPRGHSGAKCPVSFRSLSICRCSRSALTLFRSATSVTSALMTTEIAENEFVNSMFWLRIARTLVA